MWCSTSRTDMRPRSARTRRPSSSRSPAESPPAGSSSSSSSGSETSARASATRFWTPNGSVPGRRSATSATPSSPSASSARSRSRRSSRSERGSPSSADSDPGARRALGADHDVLDRGQAREQPDALQRARDAQAGQVVRVDAGEGRPAPAHRAARGPHEAADHVEQRGLAGPVGADHADDLAACHVERDVVERGEAAEAHAHLLDPQRDLAVRAHIAPRYVACGVRLIVGGRQSSISRFVRPGQAHWR